MGLDNKVPCPVCKSTTYRKPFRDTGHGFDACRGCCKILDDIQYNRSRGIRRPLEDAWMVVFDEAKAKVKAEAV